MPTSVGWDFTVFEPVPGVLVPSKAIQRLVEAPHSPLEPEVKYKTAFGTLESAFMEPDQRLALASLRFIARTDRVD